MREREGERERKGAIKGKQEKQFGFVGVVELFTNTHSSQSQIRNAQYDGLKFNNSQNTTYDIGKQMKQKNEKNSIEVKMLKHKIIYS